MKVEETTALERKTGKEIKRRRKKNEIEKK